MFARVYRFCLAKCSHVINITGPCSVFKLAMNMPDTQLIICMELLMAAGAKLSCALDVMEGYDSRKIECVMELLVIAGCGTAFLYV
jgi:hypothetical protein